MVRLKYVRRWDNINSHLKSRCEDICYDDSHCREWSYLCKIIKVKFKYYYNMHFYLLLIHCIKCSWKCLLKIHISTFKLHLQDMSFQSKFNCVRTSSTYSKNINLNDAIFFHPFFLAIFLNILLRMNPHGLISHTIRLFLSDFDTFREKKC